MERKKFMRQKAIGLKKRRKYGELMKLIEKTIFYLYLFLSLKVRKKQLDYIATIAENSFTKSLILLKRTYKVNAQRNYRAKKRRALFHKKIQSRKEIKRRKEWW